MTAPLGARVLHGDYAAHGGGGCLLLALEFSGCPYLIRSWSTGNFVFGYIELQPAATLGSVVQRALVGS